MAFFSRKPLHSSPHPEIAATPDAPADSMTILIPSRGRPEQLSALLRYFNTAEIPYPILVLLSGSRKDNLPGDYPRLKLEVIEFDAQTTLYTKVKKGMAKLATPLVAFCADDDIVLSDALRKMGGFLLQNPDYTAAQGYHGLFSEEGEHVNLLGIPYFAPSIEADDPLARMNILMRRYQPVCWAVFRTPVMTDIINSFSQELNLLFNEFLWAGVAVLKGKVKRLPMLYCLRRDDKMHFMGHPLYAMMENPQKFFAEYAAYRNILAGFLQPKNAEDKAHIVRALDLIHSCYLSLEAAPGTLNYFTDKVLANPKTSIHDADIDRAIRPAQPDLSGGWGKEMRQGNRTYRLFPQFLNPQPRDEIHLPSDFTGAILKDIQGYFG